MYKTVLFTELVKEIIGCIHHGIYDTAADFRFAVN